MPSRAKAPGLASTHDALIGAAIDLFGRKGFDATTTRQIAKAAGVNVAGIAYHFGGKEGLRRACAERIAGIVAGVVAPPLAAAESVPAHTPAEAEARLAVLFQAMIAFIVARPEAEAIARFMLREMMAPSPAFDVVYAGMMAPTHRRICELWAQATGAAADSEQTRLVTLALIGQVFYFRIARPVVVRRMGWRRIGPAEVASIGRAVAGHLHAAVAAARKEAP